MTPNRKLIERVMREKARRGLSPHKYDEHPRITFIVHSFNREANVDHIAAGLRRIEGHELIVCDEGSIDGTREKWQSHLTRPNDFLILSNNFGQPADFSGGDIDGDGNVAFPDFLLLAQSFANSRDPE